jgi:hypothetical protein
MVSVHFTRVRGTDDSLDEKIIKDETINILVAARDTVSCPPSPFTHANNMLDCRNFDIWCVHAGRKSSHLGQAPERDSGSIGDI